MQWFLSVIKEHYADFNGRARRKEYWMYVLFAVIFGIVIGIIDGVLAGVVGIPPLLSLLYGLALLIPGLAVAVRRFHDQDKSGWFILLGLIPFVGGIIVLIFMCLPGTEGDNRFGPDPKAGAAA